MIVLATALVVAILSQTADAERARAVDLARRGRTVEALHLFETMVARDPADRAPRLAHPTSSRVRAGPSRSAPPRPA